MVKELNRSEKDTLCLNPVHENHWLQYSKLHWENTNDNDIKLILVNTLVLLQKVNFRIWS